MIDQSQFKAQTVGFYTLGCKLNFSETSTIARHLQEEGFKRVSFNEPADIYVINTCSVTETADKKCRHIIHKALNTNPKAFIVVTGCFAQLKPDNIVKMPGVDLVLGSNEKFDVTRYLNDLEKKTVAEVHAGNIAKDKRFMPSYSSGDRTRSFLKVQDGCDYMCSYCTIPLARGRSRNGTIEETITQAREAGQAGAREIILTGVNIGDFGKSTGESFFDLVRALDEVAEVERIRISSIEPNLLTEEIIAFVARSKKFMPHFHIPLQSGSDKVLKLMKRRYDSALFRQRVNTIRHFLPEAFIGVDVIVGVRGETPEEFDITNEFIQSLDISQLHVFTYSERPNTKALDIEYNVPIEERKRRSQILHQLSDQKMRHFYQRFVDQTASVLFEEQHTDGTMLGFTDNYLRVEAPYDSKLTNQIVEVKLSKVSPLSGHMLIHNPIACLD